MEESHGADFRSLDAFGARDVAKGDLVRPWIGAGPFFYDVSGEVPERSFFEDLESHSGEEVFRKYVALGEACLNGAPVEGDAVAFCGETQHYRVIDNEEPLLNWGRYFRGNTLVTQFVSTRVFVDEACHARFEMRVRVDNQIAVFVNGQLQYRSYENEIVRTNHSWGGEQLLEFELDLQAGENCLSIGAFRIGRIAAGAMYMQSLDMSLRVVPPLRESQTGLDRVTLERLRDAYYPTREWFYPDDVICLRRQDDVPDENAQVTCVVSTGSKTVAQKTFSLEEKDVVLCLGKDIDQTNFEIQTTVCVRGEELAKRTFQCCSITPTPNDIDTYESRCTYALEHYANGKDAWAQVARYELGRAKDIDREVIADGCSQIDRRLDCSDFILHPFLRMLYADQDRKALPEDVAEQMKKSAINFKYWTDEPGSDCLVTGTENHQILFHTAEIIAGYLWPDEVFPNANMTGRDHIEHGRKLAHAWLLARAKTGFREWHSSSYYPHWIAALLDLFDCVPDEESKFKEMARCVLTMGFLNLASDSFEGSLVTTHGRVYAPMLKVPANDGCAGMHWLLYGVGQLGNATGVVPLACSGFRLPDVLNDIAHSKACTLTQHHQGNDAQFVVYRTPDYLMCSLQDYKPGQKAAQVHPFQITFQDKVAVFFSCPETSNEGGGHRPDYWSGNGYLPRVFGKKNVAMLLFKPGAVGWMSHCYFEPCRFDEVVEKEHWLFARKGHGYVGIWSENGYEVGTRGQYAGRELICRAGENAWVVEAGRQEDWRSFSDFTGALLQTHPRREQGEVIYHSPSVGTLQMGWSGQMKHNGHFYELGYPLLNGPYGYSAFGSGEMAIKYGGQDVCLCVRE